MYDVKDSSILQEAITGALATVLKVDSEDVKLMNVRPTLVLASQDVLVEFKTRSEFNDAGTLVIISDDATQLMQSFVTLAFNMSYVGPVDLSKVSLVAVSSMSMSPSPGPSVLPTMEPSIEPSESPSAYATSTPSTVEPTPFPSLNLVQTTDVTITLADLSLASFQNSSTLRQAFRHAVCVVLNTTVIDVSIRNDKSFDVIGYSCGVEVTVRATRL